MLECRCRGLTSSRERGGHPRIILGRCLWVPPPQGGLARLGTRRRCARDRAAAKGERPRHAEGYVVRMDRQAINSIRAAMGQRSSAPRAAIGGLCSDARGVSWVGAYPFRKTQIGCFRFASINEPISGKPDIGIHFSGICAIERAHFATTSSMVLPVRSDRKVFTSFPGKITSTLVDHGSSCSNSITNSAWSD
jgi:hypothetical protein